MHVSPHSSTIQYYYVFGFRPMRFDFLFHFSFTKTPIIFRQKPLHDFGSRLWYIIIKLKKKILGDFMKSCVKRTNVANGALLTVNDTFGKHKSDLSVINPIWTMNMQKAHHSLIFGINMYLQNDTNIIVASQQLMSSNTIAVESLLCNRIFLFLSQIPIDEAHGSYCPYSWTTNKLSEKNASYETCKMN